jgi:hypothetical protein
MFKIKLNQIVLSSINIIASASMIGCASITTGTTQSVSVKTGSVTDATCLLENNKGKWYVNKTPGTVTINRSFSDLSINCEKHGYPSAHKSVASSTKAMAFGNIVFGGVVGAGVDVVNGAAYNYPVEIDVPMKTSIA